MSPQLEWWLSTPSKGFIECEHHFWSWFVHNCARVYLKNYSLGCLALTRSCLFTRNYDAINIYKVLHNLRASLIKKNLTKYHLFPPKGARVVFMLFCHFLVAILRSLGSQTMRNSKHAWVRDHFVGHAHPRICGGLADSAGGWFQAGCFAQRWTPMIRGKRKWQVGAKQRAFQSTSPNLGTFLYLEKFNLKFINLLNCSCVSCKQKNAANNRNPTPWFTSHLHSL